MTNEEAWKTILLDPFTTSVYREAADRYILRSRELAQTTMEKQYKEEDNETDEKRKGQTISKSGLSCQSAHPQPEQTKQSRLPEIINKWIN